MSTARLALAAAVLAAAPLTLGCTKKPASSAVVVVEDTPPDAAAPGGAAGGSSAEVEPAQPKRKSPSGKPIHVRAALHGAGDLMALVKQVTTAWTPKQPIDPATQIQSILLQLGYGPGLWASLDLAGPFAVDSAFFPQDPSAGLQLVGSFAALSAKGVMEGMPSAQRPQPLGNGLWEFVQGELRVLLREQPKSLEFALSNADLGRAAGLAAEALQGRRLQLRVWDLPPGYVSGDYFNGLPGGLRKQVAAIMRETTSSTIELDGGTDRDLVLQIAAEAPFSRLGLSHLGAASTQPSALEALLPERPALVVAMPWGSPQTLHSYLDKGVRLDAIPAPFDKVVGEALASAHTILDQIASDVVFAFYFSPKGEATVVLAASVKDEAATRAAIRGVQQAAQKGIESFNQITGDDKSAKLALTYKLDGAKAGPLKADLFSLAVPKNMEKDVDDFVPFLVGKKKLEAVTLVSGRIAVFAVGGAAQKLAADVAAGLGSGRKTSLGSDAGLRLARLSSQGCHFCVGVDPTALLHFNALTSPRQREDAARLKKLAAAAETFTRIGGAVGLGLKLDASRGALAVGLPRSVLVLAPADAASLGELWGADETAPADKPLSGPVKLKSDGAR